VPKTGRAELAYSLMMTGAWTKPSGPLARAEPPAEASPLPLDPEAFAVAGVPLVIDPAGALWWAAERLLVIADLHLEKGSAFAPRGMLLPPYDSAASLARLEALIGRHRPRAVVALGDSFHDSRAGERIDRRDVETLARLQHGRDWIWIAGNHDPVPPSCAEGLWLDELALGPLTFRHEPAPGPAPGEIAGHLHPVGKVRVRARGGVRRRCVVGDGSRAVLPAFGAYAGGLNVCDRAFAPLFPGRRFTAMLLGEARVYPIPGGRLVPDW
jgi:DNA ligase-associated metallophosphoesterase